jgi:hypothetical protein
MEPQHELAFLDPKERIKWNFSAISIRAASRLTEMRAYRSDS